MASIWGYLGDWMSRTTKNPRHAWCLSCIVHIPYQSTNPPQIGRANICLTCTTSDAPTYSGVCDMLICRYNAYMKVQCGFDTYFSDTAIWALFWLLQQCQVVATIVARAHLYLIVYLWIYNIHFSTWLVSGVPSKSCSTFAIYQALIPTW